jgi:hypothetical protein
MTQPVSIGTEDVIEAVRDTFETMTFMEVMLPVEESGLEIEEPLWAAIEIMKPVQVRFILVLPNALAEEVTETLFTPDPDTPLSENLVLDTLAELVNTIGGRLMSDLVGVDQTLKLSLPEYGRGMPESKEAKIINLSVEEMYPITVIAEGKAFQAQ